MRSFAAFVVDHAWLVLGLCLAITLPAASRLPLLEVKDTIEHFFLENDPAILFYNSFLEKFETDEFFLVAFETDDAYSDENLALIRKLTDKLKNLDNIDQVVSLTNVNDIVGDGETIQAAPLIGEGPPTDAQRAAWPLRAKANPFIGGAVVAPDGRAAAIFCRSRRIADDSVYRKVMTAEVYRIIKETIPAGRAAFAAGGPIFYTEYMYFVGRDLVTFTPLTVLLLVVLMILIYRRWRAVWLPMVCITTALIWTLALLQLLGSSLNLVTIVIPPLILVIGVAVIVHVMNRYEEEYRRIGDRREGLVVALVHLIKPCFLTSFTTAVGFASLAVSHIVPIRETGLYAAFGVMSTYLVSITVAPAMLALLPPPDAKRPTGAGRRDWLDKLLTGCVELVLRRPRAIVVLSASVTLAGIGGAFLLNIETNLIEYFHENSGIRRAYRFLEERISGANSLEILIEGEGENAMLEPEVLRGMEHLQREMKQVFNPRTGRSYVTTSQSLADLLKLIHRAYTGEDGDYRLPDSRAAAAQLLEMARLGDDELGVLTAPDNSYARISGRLTTIPSRELRRLLRHIDGAIAAAFPAGIKAAATCEAVLFVNMEKELVLGQLKGFGLAIVVIIACIILLFWSWRVGLFSIYPNILPIIMTLGVMGLTGIPINLATCMMPSIAIGISVDDTIHFLSRFRVEYRARGNLTEALRTTMRTTGRAMVITSVVIFFGFFVLVASQFRPNMFFGVLTALTMIWAVAADLLVVPAMLALLRPKKF